MDKKLNSTALSTEKSHPIQTEVTEWKPMTDLCCMLLFSLLSLFAFNKKRDNINHLFDHTPYNQSPPITPCQYLTNDSLNLWDICSESIYARLTE